MRRSVPRPAARALAGRAARVSAGVTGAVLVLLAAVLPVVVLPAAAAPADDARARAGAPTADAQVEPAPVVLVGVGGLQWTDVDRAVTPTLWQLLSEGSVGSIAVRTAEPETCRTDGWLTVSAARRILDGAAGDGATPDGPGDGEPGTGTPGSGTGTAPGTDDCLPVPEVARAGSDAVGPAEVVGWADLSAEPDEDGGTPGTLAARLAEAGVCATAVGPGAALALADASGRVERYAPDLRVLDAAAIAACPVVVVDAGEPASAAGQRQAALRALDGRLEALVERAAEGTQIIVAGVHDTPIDSLGLQVAIGWTKGTRDPGWLQSASTRRPGLVTLTDLSATLVAAAGGATDDLEGSPVTVAEGRRMSPERTVENRRYLVELTTTVPHLMPVFVGVLALAVAGVLGALLLRRRSGADAAARAPAPGTRLARVVLLLAACAPAGAYLATLARWWGASAPTVAAGAWTVGAALGCALVVWVLSRLLAPGFWRLAGVAAALTWVVLTLDGVTGTTLQHGSLLGVTATLGARYYGFGNLTFAVYLASALVLAAALAAAALARGHRRYALAAVVAVGTVSVVVDGWPAFGADFGGLFALVPAFAVLLLGVTQRPPTVRRVGLTVLATAGVVALVALADWARPGDATHVGLFVQRLVDGEAWPVLAGKAAGAWRTVANPLGVLAVLACVAAALAVVGPARLRPAAVDALYRRVPLLSRLAVAVVVGAAAGTVLNDSGIAVGASVLGLAGVLLALSWVDGLVGAEPARRALREPAALAAVAGGLLGTMLLGSLAAPGVPAAAGDVATPGEPLVWEGDTVVVVGTSGLRWEDVDRQDTPTLWRLLRDGGSPAGVSVGATGISRRCDTAGWLGLSAGRAPVTAERGTDGWACLPWAVDARAEGDGAVVAGWDALETAQRRSEYRPRLGVLAEAIDGAGACATAVGPGAALALADGTGQVARYRTLDEALADGTFAACPVTVVDAGAAPARPSRELTPWSGTGQSGPPALSAPLDGERAAALRAVDTAVRRVLAAAPPDAVVLVVDVGDPSAPRPGLGVGLGPTTDGAARFLTVSSTRWEGVVRLLDVPTTLLTALGAPNPPEFTGAPLATGAVRPADTAAAVDQLAELSVRDLALRGVSGSVTTTPMLVGLALLGVGVLLGARRMRPAVVRPVAWVVDAALLVLASMPAGVYLMTTWLWWRGGTPVLDMWLCLAAATLTVAGVGALAPRRPAWAAPAVIAGITFAVLTIDALLGTPLHRGSPLGPAPALGGRYYGFGNPTYSVYVVAAVVAVAGLATWLLGRGLRRAALVVAVLGSGVALVVDVWPTLGADVGGGLILLPVLGVLVLAVAGVHVSWQRLALIGVAGLVLVAGIGWLDWVRPAADRSHLGRFVQSVLDGTAWETVSRKAGFALSSLTSGPTSWLTLVLLVWLALVLWRRRGLRARWLARVEAAWPLAHPVLVTLVLAAVGGAVVNDYGVRIATIMLFAAVPLVGLLVVRTLPDGGAGDEVAAAVGPAEGAPAALPFDVAAAVAEAEEERVDG